MDYIQYAYGFNILQNCNKHVKLKMVNLFILALKTILFLIIGTYILFINPVLNIINYLKYLTNMQNK